MASNKEEQELINDLGKAVQLLLWGKNLTNKEKALLARFDEWRERSIFNPQKET